jgi:hypothetical protein
MMKDASYHKSAIQYNEELADFAEGLSGRLEHPEVSRWARSVSKQHKFHAGRHKQALSKMEHPPEETEDQRTPEEKLADESEGVAYMHPSGTREETIHKSAIDGKFVSPEFSDENPDTTYEQTVDIPVGPGNVEAENAEVQA